MKNTVFDLLVIAFLIATCKSNRDITIQKEKINLNEEVVGHLKMGLIDYEIVDTVNTSKEMAEMMIGMMKPSIETELVFNSTRSAELVKDGDDYARRNLYDRQTKLAFEFLAKDSTLFYSEMNISNMMSEIETTEEEMKELSNMFRINPYSTSGTVILGFECDEVIMMQPPDYSEVYTKAYTTNRIPHISEAMDPMSKYFSGAQIKMIMFINGLKITVGATEYNENQLMEKYLKLETSEYQ